MSDSGTEVRRASSSGLRVLAWIIALALVALPLLWVYVRVVSDPATSTATREWLAIVLFLPIMLSVLLFVFFRRVGAGEAGWWTFVVVATLGVAISILRLHVNQTFYGALIALFGGSAIGFGVLRWLIAKTSKIATKEASRTAFAQFGRSFYAVTWTVAIAYSVMLAAMIASPFMALPKP